MRRNGMFRMIAAAGAIVTMAGSVGNLFAADLKKKVSVVVATGGHGFDRKGFDAMWASMPQFDIREVKQEKTSTAKSAKNLKDCDVLVMYDMMQPATDEEKASFVKFVQDGGGVVALHHCIASHQDWPDYERIIGGLYLLAPAAKKRNLPPSGYQHDVELNIKIADPKHPVTRGLKDFALKDEIYWDFVVDPKAHVLITTDHPKSGKNLAWTREEGKGRVVFIQMGHDNHAFSSPDYRKLIVNAINWAAGD